MVTDYYLPSLGGVQTAIKSAKESLETAGHTVTVFCPQFEQSHDPSIFALPASPVFKPDNYAFTWPFKKAYVLLAEEFRERKIDVVHVHSEMFAALAGLRAARDAGIPIVQTMHGRVDVYSAAVLPLPELSTRLLARMHARRIPHTITPTASNHYTGTGTARRMWKLMVNQANFADHVIVPSAHFAQKLLEQGVHRPTTVVSNGLEDSVMALLESLQPLRYDGVSPLRIMWCGRVSPEKRPDVFLKALSDLRVPFHADMYGEGVSFARIEKLVISLGLAGKVTLHGSVSQETVLNEMKQHHVFVSTSHDFDNQPMVLIEAMACGLPAIVMDPDLAEMFPPHGVLVTPTPAVQSLSATLSEVSTTPDKLTQVYDALLRGDTKVSQNSHVAQLERIYRSLTRAHSH